LSGEVPETRLRFPDAMSASIPARILVVDDRPSNIKILRLRLAAEGYEVLEAADGPQALDLAANAGPDLVLLDVRMPGMDGFEVCRRLKARQDGEFLPVIMVTAGSETENIVRGLGSGADEYVTKPFEVVALMARVKSMLRIRHMWQENRNLRRQIAVRESLAPMISGSRAMARIEAILPQVSERAPIVLLTGETGTGKDTLARCIHQLSQAGSFVPVNCGALSEGLLESELFGHKRGAFTGANEDRIGLFEAADGGTIFLDEIGETSAGMQVKLLRVLQEGEVVRVGENQPRKIQARVIAATNRDLKAEVEAGRFREDLYYRLSVFPIELPPLRQRPEDIPLMANHFLEERAAELGVSTQGFTPDAMDALNRYDWPGNVRELKNEIQRALVLTPPEGFVDLETLSEKIRWRDKNRASPLPGSLRENIAGLEREVIRACCGRHKGNKSRMAKELQISRWTLQQKMQLYGIG
jgi:two-component system, NtrC family, response regulator HydG